jgi:PAT family beta-lactamase induction signal transducer AmpG
VGPNPSATRRAVHPVMFFFLYFGFGAPGGFLTGTIELFYTNAGVSTQAFGLIVSIALAAQVLKVLWAPLVDTTLNVKAWYLLATAVIVPCLLWSANLPIGPASVLKLGVISLVVSIASSFLGMAADSLMAHDTAPERRGAAGGWSQAGNLGGAGVGAAAGLWVANHFHSVPISGIVVAAGTAACALALFFAPKAQPVSSHTNYLATLRLVVVDCWRVCRARAGWLTLFVLVLPLGAGGAAQLTAGLSKEWRVKPDLLAAVLAMSSLVIAAAALVGGYICDRMDRKAAYVLFGVLGGVICAGVALMPRSPEWFVVLAFAYAAALGMSYAAFSAATLEAIGGGAAATKYTLFASVSNIPVALMPALDGWADTRWNVGALLWTEFGTAVAAAVIFMLVAVATRPRRALAVA